MAARVLGLRARLAKARGALDEGEELFTRALERFGPDDPFLERTLLLHARGQLQLDRGQRSEGAATLREAERLLVSVGAEPWRVGCSRTSHASAPDPADARPGRRSS